MPILAQVCEALSAADELLFLKGWSLRRRNRFAEAAELAASLADGPTFGHAMTKTMLWQEWSAGLGECIEAEAQAQAICMQTGDFERAYRAFVAKDKPVFAGN